MKVSCDTDMCKYFKDGICNISSITVSDGRCETYEELPDEVLHPDIFYMHFKKEVVESGLRQEWEETRGKKITVLGREMFARFGSVTDGRTGSCVCSIEYIPIVEANPDKYLPVLIKGEVLGISPLYEE